MAVWDEQVFRVRVLECGRAAGFGSLRKVAIASGIDPKYFRDDIPPPEGRNIAIIFRIAETIDADPGYLIGLYGRDGGPASDVATQAATANLEYLSDVAAIAALLCVTATGRPARDARKIVAKILESLDALYAT